MNEEILRNLNYRLDKALDYSRRVVEDDEMSERIADLKRRAESIIIQHPIKSIAGGLIAGFLMGKIFSDD